MTLNQDNIAEFFGADASDVFESKERAEGYMAGVGLAERLTAGALEDLAGKSREYKLAFFDALRETL